MATTSKAILRNYRQSPRKVRLVADMIRGKKVSNALTTLSFLNKRSSDPITTLLKSAEANAKNLNLDTDNLFIKGIEVNEGTILYRRRTRARGSSAPIRKRTSHISLVLSEREQENPKSETLSSKQSQNSKPKRSKEKSDKAVKN